MDNVLLMYDYSFVFTLYINLCLFFSVITQNIKKIKKKKKGILHIYKCINGSTTRSKIYKYSLCCCCCWRQTTRKTFVLLMKFSLLTFCFRNNNGEGVLIIVYTVCWEKNKKTKNKYLETRTFFGLIMYL